MTVTAQSSIVPSTAKVASKHSSGDRSAVFSYSIVPFCFAVIRVSLRTPVVYTFSTACPSPRSVRLTAASFVALPTLPTPLYGIKYCTKVFSSCGFNQVKSGWLSVNTPVISSIYGPSVSVRFRSQLRPKSPFPQVHCFLPGEI